MNERVKKEEKMTDDKLHESCYDTLSSIAGGFVETDAQCIVVVEYSNEVSQKMFMQKVTSNTPTQSPDDLMTQLGNQLNIAPSRISVSVYGIYGGIGARK